MTRNPFLPEPSIDALSEERLLLAIMSLTRRKKSSMVHKYNNLFSSHIPFQYIGFFNLSTSDGERFCEFTLFKKCFRLGEDIMGYFQFLSGARRCYNVNKNVWAIPPFEI